MTVKVISSPFSVLTSDGLQYCQDWLDNCAIQALICILPEVVANDEFEETSDDDHHSTSVSYPAPSSRV